MNIGTLFAFILVSVGVVVLRRTRPDLPRSFRVPAASVVVYFAYGQRHSRVGRRAAEHPEVSAER